jgi:hypothetical protein
MSNTFLHPRRHTRTILILAVAVTVLLVSATALVSTLGAHTRASAAPLLSLPAPAPTVTATGSAAPLATDPGPQTPVLELVRGRTQITGVYVGYPHTQAGAVSAGIEYITNLASLDPDREAAVGRLVADSTWALAGQQFAAGAIKTRRGIGLSGTADVPAGASIEVTPVSYQLRDVSADRVNVLLLSYLVTTTPQAGTLSRTILENLPMHWDGLDWKLLKSTDAADTQYRALLATPGTAKAVGLGWVWITR